MIIENIHVLNYIWYGFTLRKKDLKVNWDELEKAEKEYI